MENDNNDNRKQNNMICKMRPTTRQTRSLSSTELFSSCWLLVLFHAILCSQRVPPVASFSDWLIDHPNGPAASPPSVASRNTTSDNIPISTASNGNTPANAPAPRPLLFDNLQNQQMPFFAHLPASPTTPSTTALQDDDDLSGLLAEVMASRTTPAPSTAPTRTPGGLGWLDQKESDFGNATAANDAEVVTETLKVYGSLYLGMFVIFCLVRKCFPRLFNVRSWVEELQCDIAQNSKYGYIDWLWKVHHESDEDILAQCGMDALCFCRILKMGRKLTIMGCCHALWLIPTYATAEVSDETSYLEDPLVKISVANIPSGSTRWLATIVCTYFVAAYAMWLILRELEWYTKFRHLFLQQHKARNYAVYVSGIPESLQNSKKLADFFQQCSATSQLLEAHIMVACPQLDSMVQQRKDVIAQLKHARAYNALKGERKKRVDWSRLFSSFKGKDNKCCEPIRACLWECRRKWRRQRKRKKHKEVCDSPSPEVSPTKSHQRRRSMMDNGLRLGQDGILLPAAGGSDSGSNKSTNKNAPSDRRSFGRQNSNSSSGGLGGLFDVVDAIEANERQLYKLTKDISYAYQKIERSNDPYTFDQHREQVLEQSRPKPQPPQHEEPESVEENVSVESPRHHRQPAGIPRMSTRVSSLGADDDDDDEDPRVIPEPAAAQAWLQHQQEPPKEDLYSQGAEALFLGPLKGSPMPSQDEQDVGLGMPMSSHAPLKTLSFQPINCGRQDGEEKTEEDVEHPVGYRLPRTHQEALNRWKSSKSTISTVPGMFEDDPDTGYNLRSPPPMPEIIEHDATNLESSISSDWPDPSKTETNNGNGDEEPETATGDDDDDEKSGHNTQSTLAHQAVSLVKEASSKTATSARRKSIAVGSSISQASKEVGHGVRRASVFGVNRAKKVTDLGVKVTAVGVKFGVNKMSKTVQQATEIGIGNVKMMKETAEAIVPVVKLLGQREGMPLEAGFVVFKDLYSTQAALQMIHHPKASILRVVEAPSPKEIFWRNVGMPMRAQRTGALLSTAATIALCFFWTIPVAFISSLTEVEGLKQISPSVGEWVEQYEGMEATLALMAPLLLIFINDVLLPEFLGYFATWEGHVSSSVLEASLFVKYSAFMLIQTFFVSAISGSITAQLQNILENPDQVVVFLANSLPAQSSYFIQFLAATMVVNMGIELLRAFPLGSALFRRYLGPNLTEEERKTTWKFFHPLEDPYEFEHAKVSGTIVLFFMVFLVYAPLAPITSFFLAIMFPMMESGYRYQFYHNYPKTPDSGGKLFAGFVSVLQACLIVSQLTVVGLLLLKESYYAAPLMTPLIVITILFTLYVNKNGFTTSLHLPTTDCVIVDDKNKGASFDFLRNVYLQPSLREAQSDDVFEVL